MIPTLYAMIVQSLQVGHRPIAILKVQNWNDQHGRAFRMCRHPLKKVVS
jgi:hypothetical protein